MKLLENDERRKNAALSADQVFLGMSLTWLLPLINL